MQIYFEVYLNIFWPYCDVVATSSALEGLAFIYYESRFKKDMRYFVRIIKGILKSLKMLRYITMKQFIIISKTVRSTSSTWIYEKVEGDYIHIDLLVVQKEYRGQKLGKKIIQYVLREAKKVQLPVTLETQNKENVKLYEHLGFKTVKTFNYKQLTQYCMIQTNKNQ
ncbi:MAG: GNAT family N-acetyltransferase [Cellulosilyticaceae bacterium]